MRVPTAIQASVAMAGAPSIGEAILCQRAKDFPDRHAARTALRPVSLQSVLCPGFLDPSKRSRSSAPQRTGHTPLS